MPIIEFFRDIYRKNSNVESTHYDTCKKYSRISNLTVNIGLLCYSAWVTVITLSGALECILTGVLKPFMKIYFPGYYEGQYSTGVFIILLLFNVSMSLISYVTTPTGDMLFFAIFANVPMVPSIIQGQLDELTAVLENKQATIKEVKYRMYQYMMMHMRYNMYVKVAFLKFVVINLYIHQRVSFLFNFL